MTANLDPEKVAGIIRECARKHVSPYFGNLEEHQIEFKNNDPNNRVTIADKESEIFLTKELAGLLPGALFVGEENYESDPSIMAALEDPANTVWVIDPVDGTGNFSRGSTTFCMIVALVEGGETKMGWIYDVCNDRMAFAEKGKGAFIDGQRVMLDQNAPMKGAQGYTMSRHAGSIKEAQVSTLRCSGHEYLNITASEAIFSLYSLMKPWDHLAGVLLVQEAGGYAAKWDGSAYKPGDRTGGLITANNRQNWQKVRDIIPHHVLQKHGIAP